MQAPLPLLSQYDPADRAEGSIDPLGTYAIADAMAVRLAPGVRERQGSPRFLTAMAVSLAVCETFDDDVLASDGESPPWQVFEWYVVEGLVRTLRDEAELRGLPGREKARRALEEGVPLCRDRYLKTASVFGYHGIYRVLARELGIEAAGRLGEFGYELVRAWATEEGLDGFLGSAGGEGQRWRALLQDAVREGLRQGAVARGSQWQGWQFMAEHLAPRNTGRREAALITRALTDAATGYRGAILDVLLTRDAGADWFETASERRFHKALGRTADPGLAELLAGAAAYERFCRWLQDAFDACRHEMTLTRGKTKPSQLAARAAVQAAAERVTDDYARAREALQPLGLAPRFEQQFADFAEPLAPAAWAVRLLEHHEAVQRAKPPDGKAPWVERFDDGGYVVRPPYRRDEPVAISDEYVHAYRTRPLWSFALELGLVET